MSGHDGEWIHRFFSFCAFENGQVFDTLSDDRSVGIISDQTERISDVYTPSG